MKRVVIAAILMVSATTLSGCGGLVKTMMTEKPSICDGMEGQSVAQVQVKLGDPDGIKRETDGTQVRTYKHGYFTGLIYFDASGKVVKTDCNKD